MEKFSHIKQVLIKNLDVMHFCDFNNNALKLYWLKKIGRKKTVLEKIMLIEYKNSTSSS